MKTSSLNRRSLLIAGAGLAASSAGFAQPAGYLDRPIKMVLPVPVGGFVDTTARMINEEFLRLTGQQVIIESKPGGSFSIGVATAANLPADGYSLFNINYSVMVAQATMKKTDVLKQFTGVALFGWTSTAVVVAADSPFRTMGDLVEWGRKNPGKLNYAIPGPGSAEHLASLDIVSGLDATPISFRGAPEMITSVIQKDSHFTVAATGLLEPYVKQGQLRFLAVIQDKRSPTFPDIPSMAESGLKVTPFVAWVGAVARKETPPERIQALHAIFNKALQNPALVARLKSVGMEAATVDTPAEFTEIIQKSLDDLKVLVAKSGLKFD